MEESHLHKQQSNCTCVLRTEKQQEIVSHLPLYIVNSTTGCIRVCPIVSIVDFLNAVINFILHLEGQESTTSAQQQKAAQFR